MARPRKSTIEISDREHANAVMRKMLIAQIEIEKQQGALDLARASATAKFEGPIDRLKTERDEAEEALRVYYMANLTQLEVGGRKSIDMAYGVMGRRIGNPTLAPLNRSWSWKAIVARLASIHGGKYFLKSDPKPDKDGLRAQLSAEELRDVGLKVEQDEHFYVECDRTTLGDAA